MKNSANHLVSESATIRINTEGKSLIMKSRPGQYFPAIRLYL